MWYSLLKSKTLIKIIANSFVWMHKVEEINLLSYYTLQTFIDESQWNCQSKYRCMSKLWVYDSPNNRNYPSLHMCHCNHHKEFRFGCHMAKSTHTNLHKFTKSVSNWMFEFLLSNTLGLNCLSECMLNS